MLLLIQSQLGVLCIVFYGLFTFDDAAPGSRYPLAVPPLLLYALTHQHVGL